MSSNDLSRRNFLIRSATVASLTTLPAWYASEAQAGENGSRKKRTGANERLNIACIGPGGSKGGFRQGLGVTRGIKNTGKDAVEVVACCDVDHTHAKEAANSFGSHCKEYHDFRELLRDEDVDAVVIGTPDHWHAIIAVEAMKKGKDVYCEKPLTLTVDEGKAIVKTQAKTRRVFQTGSQQRSDARFRLACELVRNGRIGKLKRVEARLPNGSKGGPFAVKPVPSDFDWDFWLGPTQWAEYVPERTHGSFRHWYEYSGGMMTDWGAHHLDISQWALGMDESGPQWVESRGVLPADARGYNTATDFEVTYTYANGVPLIATHRGENGIRFEGEDGWIFVTRGKIEASDQRLLDDPLPSSAIRLYKSDNHYQNWLDCIESRKDPICNAEVGHRSATVCHIGNISLRLGGRKMEWDPKAEKFKDDDEANRMLNRPYRGKWKLG
ncbi:MAG: Gfo/Idh/MocA family protein [Armatimonadota bacterium]